MGNTAELATKAFHKTMELGLPIGIVIGWILKSIVNELVKDFLQERKRSKESARLMAAFEQDFSVGERRMLCLLARNGVLHAEIGAAGTLRLENADGTTRFSSEYHGALTKLLQKGQIKTTGRFLPNATEYLLSQEGERTAHQMLDVFGRADVDDAHPEVS